MSYEDDVRVIATMFLMTVCVLLSHLTTGPSIGDGPHQARKYNCERTSEEGRLTPFPPRWLRDWQHRRQLGQKHDRRRASRRTGVCRELIRKGKNSRLPFPSPPPPTTTHHTCLCHSLIIDGGSQALLGIVYSGDWLAFIKEAYVFFPT
jgi:hypothetical protein